MAQQTAADETTNAEDGQSSSEELIHRQIAEKLLDEVAGHHNETFADTDGEIVAVDDDPITGLFDVLAEVEFPRMPRLVDSRGLGRHDVDGMAFHGVESTPEGWNLIQFSIEYEGRTVGFHVYVGHEPDGETETAGGR
jgi:hypothetical protein